MNIETNSILYKYNLESSRWNKREIIDNNKMKQFVIFFKLLVEKRIVRGNEFRKIDNNKGIYKGIQPILFQFRQWVSVDWLILNIHKCLVYTVTRYIKFKRICIKLNLTELHPSEIWLKIHTFWKSYST